MFQNYFKTAYRSLLKNKTYSAVNILGLTIGLACCLFIALYVVHESSYDKFFPASERIHRIALERIYPERVRFIASSPVTLAPTLRDNYPELAAATRLHRLFFQSEVPVQIDDQSFIETQYYFADSNFFKVFTFEFLEGEPNTALNAPNKVVLTDKTARKYFGNQTALNKTVQQNNNEYLIAGVIKDIPENSHLDFDLIGSIHSLGFIQNAINTNSWINPWVYTYVKLKEGIPPNQLSDKLPQMVQQYGSADISNRLGNNYAELGHRFNYFLQPIEDIHLHSNLDIEVRPTSNVNFLYLLAAVAFFILLLSGINFVNLSTARSSERAREVGVRKVVGSTKRLIIGQFVLEAILSCLISFLLAIGLAAILMPSFNQLVGQTLYLSSLINSWSIIGVIALVAVIGAAAGLYPALVISSIDSATVLKGNYKSSNKGILLRNALIVFQFFITLVMISGTLFVQQQMQFLVDKDLGFTKDQIIIIRQAQQLGNQLETFKNELRKSSDIDAIGGTGAIPGDFMGSNIFRFTDTNIADLRANTVTYDDDFMATLNLKIIEGRAFEKAFNDSTSIIINQAVAKEMNIAEPIGKKLSATNGGNGSRELTIVGVVEDFNFTSLHKKVTPLLIFNGSNRFRPNVLAIRANTNDYAKIRPQIETAWTQIVPDQPIKLSFLNQELYTLYEADRTTEQVFRIFTYIAIFIAFVGLFSLAAYILQLRTKEISIRKVLGASLPQIFVLLSKNFVQLMLMALVLSIPVSYYAIQQWLDYFAYHIDIEWWTFLQTGGIALLLVFAAISYQSIKIAFVNPAEALKSE